MEWNKKQRREIASCYALSYEKLLRGEFFIANDYDNLYKILIFRNAMGHINKILFDLEHRGYTSQADVTDPVELDKLVKKFHESKKEVIILTNPYGKNLYEIYVRDISQPETHGPFINFGG